MLSLFPRPNAHTLDLRRQHIARREAALCAPLSDDAATASSLTTLAASEIDIQDGDVEILSSDLAALSAGIKSRKWSSVEVTQAFIRSARRAQLASNPITEPNFKAALQRARELDAHLEKNGDVVGPLHGIPFSFKDQYNVKGLRTTLGYTSWTAKGPANDDASLAQLVYHLGGVIIAKTNVPQTMLSFECNNPLFGRTTNPHSSAHTCGGSSGGEAALLASDGSAAGFGSDIGGSLRIPTGYCGIYALKPTKGRLPSKGTASARDGFEAIPVSVAQMCRSAADVEYIMRHLIPLIHPAPDSPLDPSEAQDKFGSESLRCSPLRTAWFDPLKVASTRKRPLRLGYYACDGFVKSSPAVVRSIKESIAALQTVHGNAIELVAIDPAALQTKQAMRVFLAAVGADGFDGLLGPLRQGKVKEPMDRSLFVPVFLARAPAWVRKVLFWITKYVLKDGPLSYCSQVAGRKTAAQHFATVAERNQYERDFESRVWKHYNLDAILCPVQGSPAVPHGATAKLSTLAISTIIYNVLDTAVCVLPVTRVDSDLDALPPKFQLKTSEWERTPGFELCSKTVSYALYDEGVYDPVKMRGLPLAVQVVARKYEEEKAIGIMRLLDDALREVKGDGQRYGWGPGAFARKQLAMGNRRATTVLVGKEEEKA